jgi:hypothetical protein
MTEPTEPTLTPHAVVPKWRGDTRKERSISQEHFIGAEGAGAYATARGAVGRWAFASICTASCRFA